MLWENRSLIMRITVADELPLGPGVAALSVHSGGLLALDKPAGVRSHPNRNLPDRRALLAAAYDSQNECYGWMKPDGAAGRLYLLHRLDAPVSGVILTAFSEKGAARAKALFAERRVEKVYYAVVRGHFPGLRETWRDHLRVEHRGGRARTRTGGGSEAVTHVRCLRVPEHEVPCSLLELKPLTGLTHQLRVQCARRGLPIIGDRIYGDFRFNRGAAKASGSGRLFLHALRISLPGSCGRRRFQAASPPPPEFSLLAGCFDGA